ncbi:MAG: phosphoribulokinase [Egibacteraceae bacterium]
MPDKLLRMQRAAPLNGPRPSRPVMLAIAGDSAAGKTSLARGIVNALDDQIVSICVDDYHRYDRQERKQLPFTPLHPDCNYVEIMEQHLQLLATGHPILKPVYDHSTGQLVRPELIEPHPYVIVEGLLPLFTKLSRACFDITVYLDPPEEIRREWKIARDCGERGYTPDQVIADLERREPESAAFIRPQRVHADIVVRFRTVEGRDDPPGTPLSAELLLRPTIEHPNLSPVLTDDVRRAVHLKLIREDGRPLDALHVHGHAPREDSRLVEKAIWDALGHTDPVPESLGELKPGTRSEPLAITQLIILYHLLRANFA